MATKLVASVNSDFGVKGFDIGLAIVQAQGQADATKRQNLIEIGLELAGLAQQSVDFLAGYEQAFRKAAGVKDGEIHGVSRTRKSEARAVMTAIAHTVSTKGKESAQAVIEALPAGWDNFLKACRDINTVADGGDPTKSGKTTEPKKLDADDILTIGKRLAKSGAGVALGIMEQAQKVFVQNAGTPENLVERVADMASIMSKSSDKFYAKLGQKIEAECVKAREHAAKYKAKLLLEEQARVDAETAKIKEKSKAAKKADKPTPAVASDETIAALSKRYLPSVFHPP